MARDRHGAPRRAPSSLRTPTPRSASPPLLLYGRDGVKLVSSVGRDRCQRSGDDAARSSAVSIDEAYLGNLETKGQSLRRRPWPEGPSPRNSANHDSCSISAFEDRRPRGAAVGRRSLLEQRHPGQRRSGRDVPPGGPRDSTALIPATSALPQRELRRGVLGTRPRRPVVAPTMTGPSVRMRRQLAVAMLVMRWYACPDAEIGSMWIVAAERYRSWWRSWCRTSTATLCPSSTVS